MRRGGPSSSTGIAAEEGLLEVRWITSETDADARRLYDRVAGAVPFVTYVSAV